MLVVSYSKPEATFGGMFSVLASEPVKLKTTYMITKVTVTKAALGGLAHEFTLTYDRDGAPKTFRIAARGELFPVDQAIGRMQGLGLIDEHEIKSLIDQLSRGGF